MRKGERLEKMIKESHYKNVNQFSKVAGVPYTTIKSFIDRDLERASIDAVVKMAKVLNVSVEELIGEDAPVSKRPENEYTYFPTAISAGLPLEVDGISEATTISISDEFLGRYKNDKSLFFARINGDSMNNLMEDNSLIAVKPITLDGLKNGDIVVYSSNHEYSVKHYFKYGDTIVFKPNSSNEEHEEKEYSINDNIVIHGKVVVYIVELD